MVKGSKLIVNCGMSRNSLFQAHNKNQLFDMYSGYCSNNPWVLRKLRTLNSKL